MTTVATRPPSPIGRVRSVHRLLIPSMPALRKCRRRDRVRVTGGPTRCRQGRISAESSFRGRRRGRNRLHRAAGRHCRPVVGISRTLFALNPRLAVHRAVADLEIGNEILAAVGLHARNQRVAERTKRVTRRLDILCRRKRGRGLRQLRAVLPERRGLRGQGACRPFDVAELVLRQ